MEGGGGAVLIAVLSLQLNLVWMSSVVSNDLWVKGDSNSVHLI